jgi:hypothetical protein
VAREGDQEKLKDRQRVVPALFAGRRRFTLTTDTDVYFCDRQSLWQRGSNKTTMDR